MAPKLKQDRLAYEFLDDPMHHHLNARQLMLKQKGAVGTGIDPDFANANTIANTGNNTSTL